MSDKRTFTSLQNSNQLGYEEAYIERQHERLISRRFFIEFIAGCFGGAAGTVVGYPFDTVKVRLQTQVASKRTYNGTFDCAVKIVKMEGVTGLFKGITAPVLGLAGMNAIVFGVHGNTMHYMQPGPKSEAIAGGLAGLCQTLLICPVELVKTKLQIQGKGKVLSRKQKKYQGPVDCFMKIYRQQGLTGCYRGMVVTVIRDIPGGASYFWLYHSLCHAFIPRGKTINDVGAFELFLCGGITGMISCGHCYPIDVIKSRIQADGIAPFGKYTSTLNCVKISLQQDGYRVFFRGISACLMRAFPVNAVTFATVETTLKIIENSP